MSGERAVATRFLVGLNVLVYLYMIITGAFSEEGQEFFLTWGLVPGRFLGGDWWQPITCLFIHGGLLHLLMNMVGLWSLGTPIENTIGSARFTWLYFISGAVGSLFVIVWHLIMDGGTGPDMPTVGASGAVLGVLGALAVFYPNSMLLVFFIPMRAITAVLVFAALSVVFLITGAIPYVSHLGHLGGLVAGVLYSKFALGLSFGRQHLSPGRASAASTIFQRRQRAQRRPEDDIMDLLNSLGRRPGDAPSPPREKVINPRPEDFSSPSDYPDQDDRIRPEEPQPGDGRRLYFDPVTGKFFFK